MNSLRQTKNSIYKYANGKGVNAALVDAENSSVYKTFQKELEKVLFSQIVFVIKEKNYFDNLLTVYKQESFLETQIKTILGYVSLDKIVDFKKYILWAANRGGQDFLDSFEVDAVFGLKNKQALQYFDNYTNLLIDSVDETTKKWIAQKIQYGKNNLMTPFEISDMLTQDGRNISAIRAERIVLTETAKAMMTVEVESARKAGIKRIEWRTSRDERVCPICGPLHGKYANIGGSFDGGYTFPPAHVSCRCYIREEIPDMWTKSNITWLGA